MVTDVIDTTFDFRSDTPPGQDPDACSPTLRRYHQFLWSKPLPDGTPFELDVTTPYAYLHHLSEVGEFFLTSDAVIPTFTRWRIMKHITEQIPEAENEAFRTLGYTIGGMMVFPGNQVDGKQTINAARGMHPQIRDRFDLTLECIRRYYRGEPNNPLRDTLARYADFFRLFGDLAGYVDFFHLQDLVDEASSTVKFFTPFGDFGEWVLPASLDAYLRYRRRAMEFIESRNRRIAAYQRLRPPSAVEEFTVAPRGNVQAADEQEYPRDPLSADEFAALASLVTNAAIRGVLDLCARRPGECVSYKEICEYTARSRPVLIASLGGLTRLVKKRFGKNSWPFDLHRTADGSDWCFRLDDERAAWWMAATASDEDVPPSEPPDAGGANI